MFWLQFSLRFQVRQNYDHELKFQDGSLLEVAGMHGQKGIEARPV